MADERNHDGVGGSDPSGAGTDRRTPAGEQTVKVGARDVVRPDGTVEGTDGEGSLDERLARKDSTPAGPSDAGVG